MTKPVSPGNAPEPAPPADAGNVLLVASFDSEVGFAWWLMEAYWAEIAVALGGTRRVFLAYPRIGRIPDRIAAAPLECVELDFRDDSEAGRERLALFLETHRIRSVYLSDGSTFDPRYAWLRQRGVERIVVHVHTASRPTSRLAPRTIAKKLLHAVGRRSADYYVAVSPYAHEGLRTAHGVPAKRALCVQSGIDFVSVAGRSGPSADLPEAEIRVAMVGRVEPGKGIDFALDVMACLRDRARSSAGDGTNPVPHIRLIHAGSGPSETQTAKRIVDEGLEAHVSLLGYRTDVADILRGCQIGFHPSEREVGYCLAILEMLDHGLPVVLPRLDSVDRVLRQAECGLAYRAGDVEAAADAILALARDPARRAQAADAGRRLVREEYDLGASIECFRERVIPILAVRDQAASREA